MWKQMDAYLEEDPDLLVVADIPLLFETGQASLYDGVMVVYIPRALQMERLMVRNALNAEQAKQRIDLQMDIEEKRRLADFIIDNSGTLEDTEGQIAQFWRDQGLP
jgi:dephospho-CoA kinase